MILFDCSLRKEGDRPECRLLSFSTRLESIDPPLFKTFPKLAVGFRFNEHKVPTHIVLVIGAENLDAKVPDVTWVRMGKWNRTSHGSFRLLFGKYLLSHLGLELPVGTCIGECRYDERIKKWVLTISLTPVSPPPARGHRPSSLSVEPTVK